MATTRTTNGNNDNLNHNDNNTSTTAAQVAATTLGSLSCRVKEDDPRPTVDDVEEASIFAKWRY